MENYHGARGSTTKGTGGKRGRAADKKLRFVGGNFTATKVGAKENRKLRHARGHTIKVKLRSAKFVNVLGKDGKMKRATLRTVLETPDNRHYARQNILTKGAVVDTDIGKVKITNRVGQDGVVNGKLL